MTETIRVFYTGHAGGAVYGALTIAVLVGILLLGRWSSRRQAGRHRRGTHHQSTFDEQTWTEAAHILGVPVHDYDYRERNPR